MIESAEFLCMFLIFMFYIWWKYPKNYVLHTLNMVFGALVLTADNTLLLGSGFYSVVGLWALLLIEIGSFLFLWNILMENKKNE